MKLAEIQRINATKQLHVGDKVQVNGYACELIGTSDPALVTLKTGSGVPLKIGRLRLAEELFSSRRRGPSTHAGHTGE